MVPKGTLTILLRNVDHFIIFYSKLWLAFWILELKIWHWDATQRAGREEKLRERERESEGTSELTIARNNVDIYVCV